MAECESNYKLYEKYSKLATEKGEQKPQDIDLNELGCIVENLKYFLAFMSDGLVDESNVIIKIAEFIISFGLVPDFNSPEDRGTERQIEKATKDVTSTIFLSFSLYLMNIVIEDFDSQDFPFIPENGEKCFKYLKLLLNEVKHFDTLGKRRFCIHAILLCATHNKKYLWSSYDSVAMSEDFLNELLICTNQKDLSCLLTDDTFHPSIFKGILKHMRPSLLKDTWMKNPSSCYIFFWILSHVKHPHLEEYLPDIFPPPFMFISYFAIPQQVLGIKCFDHILDNVPPTLLRIDGKEDAIYHAFTPLIYSKEYPIIEVLYPCLLKLPMMKRQKLSRLYWTQYDHVLHHLIANLEMESNVRFQRLYLSHIHSYIESIPPFKHLKRILKALNRNLSVYDGPEGTCGITSLKIMKSVIKLCWPRMEYYCLEILNVFLKLIRDLEANEEHLHTFVTDEIYNICEECLCLLKDACYEKFAALANSYAEGAPANAPGLKVLMSAMDKKE